MRAMTPSYPGPVETPRAALRRHAARRPDAEALSFPLADARLSFAGWLDRSESLARALLALGWEPGRHVALLLSRGFRSNRYLEMVEGLRPRLPLLRHVVCFDGAEGGAQGFDALAAGDDAYRRPLESNNSEAIERGLFGVPSIVCRGKLFFGNDRPQLLEGWLGGAGPQIFAR
jgi:hypothetical protein